MEHLTTLVAFYGDTKPTELADFIRHTQAHVSELLGNSFTPRTMHDVHATIVGLESLGAMEERILHAQPALADFLSYLKKAMARHPLTVQLGGFPNTDLPVSSRGQRLFERTLTRNAENVVLMGWPVTSDGTPNDALDRLRRDAQRFGITHRYHQGPNDRDPDLYMVIGKMNDTAADQSDAVGVARRALADRGCTVPLDFDALQVASYVDTQLPSDSTSVWPVGTFTD